MKRLPHLLGVAKHWKSVVMISFSNYQNDTRRCYGSSVGVGYSLDVDTSDVILCLHSNSLN